MGKPSDVVAQSQTLSDFLSVCRLCLSKSNVNVEIFNDNQTLSLPFRIMACASLEVSPNDELPKQICDDCRYQLEKSYVFRKRCTNSNTKLHRYIHKLTANKITHYFKNSDDENEFADSQEFFNDWQQKKMEQLQKKIEDNERHFQMRFHDEGTIRILELFDEVKQNVVHMDTSSIQLKNTPLIQSEINSEIKITIPKFQVGDEPNMDDLEQIGVLCDELQEIIEDQENLEQNDTDVIVPNINIEQNVKYEENDFDEDSECKPLTVKESDSVINMETQEDEQKSEDEEYSEYKPESDEESDWSNNEESDWSNNEESDSSNNEESDSPRNRISLNSMGATKQLKRHGRKSNGNGEKIFKCNICGKHFSQKWILKRHIMVHTGDRPFKCKYCDKSFLEKSILNFHISGKHTDNGIAELNKCPFCPKTFAFPSGLSRHLRMHTGKLFPCKHCAKKFKDQSARWRHLKLEHPLLTS